MPAGGQPPVLLIRNSEIPRLLLPPLHNQRLGDPNCEQPLLKKSKAELDTVLRTFGCMCYVCSSGAGSINFTEKGGVGEEDTFLYPSRSFWLVCGLN